MALVQTTVYLHNIPVGELYSEHGSLCFQYHEVWLNHAQAVPLSVSLPLVAAAFDEPWYFRGLLPHGQARQRVVASLDEDDDFKLLQSLAGDCVGAVNVGDLPAKVLPASLYELSAEDRSQPYLHLTQAAWQKTLDHARSDPLLASERGIKMCLPGDKTKFAIYQPSDQPYLPLKGNPSSHIVKFDANAKLQHTLLQQTSQLGLDVVAMQPHEHYLISQRFDRECRHADVICHHQESFAQALGQRQPAFFACLQLVKRYSVQPALDLKKLLQWYALHYFAGNEQPDTSDLTLLLLPRGPQLAPFHRIDADKTVQLRPFDNQYWQDFACQHQIKFKLIKLIIDEFRQRIELL